MSQSESIRSTVLALLPSPPTRPELQWESMDPETCLLEVGLIDSTRLVDIILEVETRCGVQFNPESVDFESGVTLGSLIEAFTPAGA